MTSIWGRQGMRKKATPNDVYLGKARNTQNIERSDDINKFPVGTVVRKLLERNMFEKGGSQYSTKRFTVVGRKGFKVELNDCSLFSTRELIISKIENDETMEDLRLREQKKTAKNKQVKTLKSKLGVPEPMEEDTYEPPTPAPAPAPVVIRRSGRERQLPEDLREFYAEVGEKKKSTRKKKPKPSTISQMPSRAMSQKNLELARKKRAELLAQKAEAERKIKKEQAKEAEPVSENEGSESDEEELILREPRKKEIMKRSGRALRRSAGASGVAKRGGASLTIERLTLALEKLEAKLAKAEATIQKAEEPKEKRETPVINIYNTTMPRKTKLRPPRLFKDKKGYFLKNVKKKRSVPKKGKTLISKFGELEQSNRNQSVSDIVKSAYYQDLRRKEEEEKTRKGKEHLEEEKKN
eukprot:g64025.t1